MGKRKIPRWILLLVTLSALIVLLYYLVTKDELNLITGLIFLAAVGVSVFIVADVVTVLFKASANTRNNIRLLVITVLILTVGVELFLRFGLNKYSTYLERNGRRNYFSLYQYNNPTWFHLRGANQDLVEEKPEFTHLRRTNSLGLAEEEIAAGKSEDEYRIIALGDSYTEGVGTSYDSTWIKVVEKSLTESISGKKITTINAGISGSDPYFQYILLRESLLQFKPDLVIVAINNSDVNDVLIRGGMERFQPDGSTVFSRKPPGWEWVYAISYIYRHIVHDVLQYNLYLIKGDKVDSEELEAVEKIKESIEEFKRLSKEHNFDLLVAVHPQEWEMIIERYVSNLDSLLADLKGDQEINLIDLLEQYLTNGIITKENASDFYWRLDSHHNTKGYEVMGLSIADKIIELRLIE